MPGIKRIKNSSMEWLPLKYKAFIAKVSNYGPYN
jgi:hypothetical protein